jgi:hypothetical protein
LRQRRAIWSRWEHCGRLWQRKLLLQQQQQLVVVVRQVRVRVRVAVHLLGRPLLDRTAHMAGVLLAWLGLQRAEQQAMVTA